VQSFAFKDKTGYSGKHHKTGVKISVVVEETGVPIAMVTAKGNIVDVLHLLNETDNRNRLQYSLKKFARPIIWKIRM
jgi:transposase